MAALESSSSLGPVSKWNLLPLILDILQSLREILKRQLHEGLYEVLVYDAVLELQDAHGECAIFRKFHRVKFLQDNVIAYQDYAWGDGELFADYRCSPGAVVDRYQEGNRWNVLISLRETKSRGKVEDFHIERKIVGGFRKSEEWWQLAMQHDTKSLKFAVIFPTTRPCHRAVVLERMKNRTTALDVSHFTVLPDGRQMLSWQTMKPRRFETYTFKWWW